MKIPSSRFSVILCSRNRAQQISRCLTQLDLDPFLAMNGELILVDNGSSDDTAQVIADFMRANPDVPCAFVSVEEAGLSIARNAGIRASSGEILIFLDDDVYLGEGYIRHVLNRLEIQSPEVDMVGGRILLYDPEDSRYGCKFGTKFRERPAGSTIRPGDFQGTNFCIRRSVYQTVGGFDESLGAGKKYRCEDIDFAARALAAGFRGAFDPALEVFHHHGRKDGAESMKLDRENIYATGAYYAKMIRTQRAFYGIRAALDFLKLVARRMVPLPPKLCAPWTAFRAFWSGFRDFWRDSERAKAAHPDRRL